MTAAELQMMVWLYDGSYKNIKITTPEDLEIGEIFARETYDKKK